MLSHLHASPQAKLRGKGSGSRGAPRARAGKTLCELAALAVLLLGALSVLAQQDSGIVAVEEDGHTVYVNAEPARRAPAATARPVAASQQGRLVYWSSKEKRWKPAPHPTVSQVEAARSAASEVASYIAARPRTDGVSDAASNPNYAGVSRGYAVSSQQIDQAIDESAQRHGVDPNLVRAVIKVESNFNPRAVSSKGAMGLMQLMPQTARQLSVGNPFDPTQNVDAGVRHLRQLLDSFGGDVKLSLAAYNAGAGAVARNRGVPPYRETRDYVQRITRIYAEHGGARWGAGSQPVRMFRGPDGVLRITNTGD